MKVEIYSDIVCPWCYIGERRFAKALAASPSAGEVEVVFRPYQLDPAAPREAVPLTRYLEGRYGDRARGMLSNVSAAAEREGIAIDWTIALAANTRTAHRLLRLAEREYGPAAQRALMERLFDQHFTRGGNIADPALLTEQAVAVGMDRDRVAGYLASDEGAAELDAEFDQARAVGVRAVPTFVFDDQWALEGAQPTDVFLEALQRVAESPAREEQGDQCDDDGCAIDPPPAR